MDKKTGMNLRTRITVAFIAVILIPVLLCLLVFSFLVNVRLKEIRDFYGGEKPVVENLYNNAFLMAQTINQDLDKLQAAHSENPRQLEDRNFLQATNEEMRRGGVFLVVQKGGALYFNGSQDLTDAQLERLLYDSRGTQDGGAQQAGAGGPAQSGAAGGGTADIQGGDAAETEEEVSRLLTLRSSALVKELNFTFADGTAGRVLLVSLLDQLAPEIRRAMRETIFLILAILSITCACMGVWIYRGVMRPIGELQRAAQNIKGGNLNFTIQGSGVKEINDLCSDFEEMRQRLRDSAEEKVMSDRRNREMISNISHDLKTPVTAIKGYAEGLIDGVAATPERRQKYLRTIYSKTTEVERLLDELTMYAKIDNNRIPYNFQKLHVRDYFRDCQEELQMELENDNIQLRYFDYLQEDAVVIADPEQLRRVINNIVGNSVKYMDKPVGVINLRLRDVGDYIQVEIEDNGKGIAQKDITRIFDRFFRSDAARRARGGSGIGLSIVKKIIEDHEGKVWATSKEGEGTVMYFVLRKYRESDRKEERGAQKSKSK